MKKTNNALKKYSELIKIETFMDRYRYLKLDGVVGKDTFGFDRYLNQKLYHSKEWKRVKDFVIARDLARDLGVEGFDINGRIYIHHMNPITQKDIVDFSDYVFDPEFLITTTHRTHNAIHYGNEDQLVVNFVERKPNDTIPWLK